MPVKLSTTVTKVSLIRNSTKSHCKRILRLCEKHGCFQKHINNNLEAIMNFDSSLDAKTSFLEIRSSGQILGLLTIIFTWHYMIYKQLKK